MSRSPANIHAIGQVELRLVGGNSHAEVSEPSFMSHLERRPEPSFVENSRIKSSMDSMNSHPDINRLLDQMWKKDPDTYRHCHRVADLSQAVGREMGLSAQERVEIYLCGLLHDVGKLLTPDHILKKPGALTPEEFAVIRLHPEDSGKIVRTINDIGYLAHPIRSHHERFDGKGYPDQKVGESIPIYARIVLVADTFDAMTNNRVYRKQLDLNRTYEELTRCSGTQFDRVAAMAFIALHQRFSEEATKKSLKDAA
jgi:putative nucleotidyltransferase with HDIG domain